MRPSPSPVSLPVLPDEVLVLIWERVHRHLRRRMDAWLMQDVVLKTASLTACRHGSWLVTAFRKTFGTTPPPWCVVYVVWRRMGIAASLVMKTEVEYSVETGTLEGVEKVIDRIPQQNRAVLIDLMNRIPDVVLSPCGEKQKLTYPTALPVT